MRILLPLLDHYKCVQPTDRITSYVISSKLRNICH